VTTAEARLTTSVAEVELTVQARDGPWQLVALAAEPGISHLRCLVLHELAVVALENDGARLRSNFSQF